MIEWITARYQHRPPFRICETPVFIPRSLKNKLIQGCEDIVDTITHPDFYAKTHNSIPAGQIVPNENKHTFFLQADFAVCRDENGELYPQLIEAQGFPSLYFFQDMVLDAYRRFFDLPTDLTALFGGLDRQAYRSQLRDIIIGDEDPEQVILLEVEPLKQATRIDFIVANEYLGIPEVSIHEVEREGRQLYYRSAGRRIPIRRIFNRVILDELRQRVDLPLQFSLIEDVDVTWAGHPNWFLRISKHTLPLIDSPYSPDCRYLSNLDTLPTDLENYVLKPIFSFAGSGVKLNLTPSDLENIADPENYILQRKVEYAPAVDTPSGPSKAEIRMMFVWPEGAARPHLVNNLIRLSKGEMVGVRYNKDKTWVGGSVGLFEP
jgi:hypothetical protein